MPLVNWQTGLATGNEAGQPNCANDENTSDTYCSSFVSAVTYWGTHDGQTLFAPGSIDFLRPFNGPAANVPLPAGVAYPLDQCAWRDYLSNYQHDWLGGLLLPPTPLPLCSNANRTWDYWTRHTASGDPPAPGQPSGWVALLQAGSLNQQDPLMAHLQALPGPTTTVAAQTMWAAQQLANLGQLVVASFKAATPHSPGHIAVVRSSPQSVAALLSDGPTVISVGAVNERSVSLRRRSTCIRATAARIPKPAAMTVSARGSPCRGTRRRFYFFTTLFCPDAAASGTHLRQDTDA